MAILTMEFIAATKDGIFVMDALDVRAGGEGGTWKDGKTAEGNVVKVVTQLPSPPNAFGHSWSADGELLASSCDEGVRIYNASEGYKVIMELEKVAPDVAGRVGGVRNVRFSPMSTYLVTYEKWDPQYPENVHVWALTGDDAGKRLYSCVLKGYTSGGLPLDVFLWTKDESVCLEMVPGKGLVLREKGFGDDEGIRVIPEKNCALYKLSEPNSNGITYVSCYTPESTSVARVAIYEVNTGNKTFEMHLPAKVKDCKMMWNFDGSAVLFLASSDVDETGCSYFGTSYLYWAKPDSKVPVSVYGAGNEVQDIAWSPSANEFMVIIGAPPSTVVLHDGKTGKLASTIGKARRNTLKWNPFGRFVAVGGWGTLAGDLDFFDRSKEETISSLRAPLTVDCAFGPDGRHFLTCTVAPRMNEGNQISMYKYTGELLFRLDYVPEHIEGRHEDTGAGARTKTQALLYAASWRPVGGSRKYEDRAASPPKNGAKRKKGIADEKKEISAGAGGAYRPKNAEGGGISTVAAMMRGDIPERPAWSTDGEKQAPDLKPMEDWEIKKLHREAQKEAAKKEKEAEEAKIQQRKDAEKAEMKAEKKIKELKAKLEELQKLKDKEWDEVTSDDEAELEKEAEIVREIEELEKLVGK